LHWHKDPFDRLLIIECNQSLKEAPFGTLTRARAGGDLNGRQRFTTLFVCDLHSLIDSPPV
jgi:hypothetical protein